MMFCVRDHPYFDGDDNPHLQTLHRMLLAHTILDPELGYAQKMIDIMSLIIITMDDEVSDRWSVVGVR
jgi:hypothetical protein